ncbi:DUF58 domain-containing protein [Nakamurella sp. YIM 132087]|uniref:DUF58 domain-containing protein n=1 Tax=Nakamurella alba TaxID=2665158 RepID=A0A7K1FQU4_9ACTN|nr:DUF58 domain-containing protein [Nakamurella alba]MTD16521.1 DUF58 domain-containing protein [Nakamurella alba]
MAAAPDKARRKGPGGRGLTTRGRCLLAGGVAAGICAIVLDERDLLRVGLLAIALPVLAVLFTALRRSQLSVEHRVRPERLQPGSQGWVTLVVRNTGQTRSQSIDIAEEAVDGLTPGVRWLISPIRRGGEAEVRYPYQASRRGRFVLGPPLIRFYDPFDLWEEHRTLDVRTEVLVLPSLVPLTGMPRGSGVRSAASGRAALGTVGGDPDVGVRPYRSGDDIRTIHWRASARHDDLVVRLDEPVSHGGATVLLDHRGRELPGGDRSAPLETGVTIAASVALHLLAADNEVRLTDQRARVLAEGHDISDDVLAGLAVIEPDDDATFAAPSVGRTGLLIAVVGDLARSDAVALASAKNRSVNAIAFVLRTADWSLPEGVRPPPGVPDPDCTGVLEAAGWRVVVVGRGDDLGTAWRRACSAADAGIRPGPQTVGAQR